MNSFKNKLVSFVLSLIVVFQFGITSLAVNDELDNPNDDVISQNEQQTDLLNEIPESAPNVSAAAYVLIDGLSGDILLGDNYDVQMEPASTTKVMTVLLALTTLDMDEVITVTPEMAEKLNEIPLDYVRLGLQENEEITVQDLVYAAVLKSANDACLVMGMYMAGTEEAFCDMMNQKAVEVGCKNTHFSSSFGYANPDNLTTAYDLCMILQEAVKKTNYTEIAKTYTYTIPATNVYSDNRVLNNANRFVSTTEYAYEYYAGGKTGYTDSAGNTLVAAANKNDRLLIGCVLKADNADVRYQDLIRLFEYGYSSYTTMNILSSEFDGLVNETTTYINNILAETNLYMSDSHIALSEYLTTTTSRASSGSTNQAELSGLQIDTSLKNQTLTIPLCKEFSDGKKYIIGIMQISIEEKASVVEVNPIKKNGWKSFKDILITVAAISGLILILIIGLLITRRQILKKRYNDGHGRSKML